MLLNIQYNLRFEDPKNGQVKYVKTFSAGQPVYTVDRSEALKYDTEILARNVRNQYKLKGVNPWPIKIN